MAQTESAATTQTGAGSATIEPGPETAASGKNRLRPGALGMTGVVFTVLATAAPITAMTGNVPIAIGAGNGIGAPAGFLVAEVLILLLLGGAVLVHGGGPDGLVPSALSPSKGFTAVAGGSVAIGLFFAFWSWVGFETTAVYGEESRNPTRIIPRATLIVV